MLAKTLADHEFPAFCLSWGGDCAPADLYLFEVKRRNLPTAAPPLIFAAETGIGAVQAAQAHGALLGLDPQQGLEVRRLSDDERLRYSEGPGIQLDHRAADIAAGCKPGELVTGYGGYCN